MFLVVVARGACLVEREITLLEMSFYSRCSLIFVLGGRNLVV